MTTDIITTTLRIAHSVTPVIEAKEPRLTVVNSFQPLNPFVENRTILSSFRDVGTDDDTHGYEYARHAAWRVRGQLEWLIQNEDLFGKHDDICDALDNAASELARARDLIGGNMVEKHPYQTQEGE